MSSEGITKDQARSLFLDEKYQELIMYAELICRLLVDSNSSAIWSMSFDAKNDEEWNVISYDNIVYMILGGSKFPERLERIEELKSFTIKVATASTR